MARRPRKMETALPSTNTASLLIARARIGEQRCYAVERVLSIDEVDTWRHHHCEYYDACLDAAESALPRSGQSWICGMGCAGRQTWKPYKNREWSNERTLDVAPDDAN